MGRLWRCFRCPDHASGFQRVVRLYCHCDVRLLDSREPLSVFFFPFLFTDYFFWLFCTFSCFSFYLYYWTQTNIASLLACSAGASCSSATVMGLVIFELFSYLWTSQVVGNVALATMAGGPYGCMFTYHTTSLFFFERTLTGALPRLVLLWTGRTGHGMFRCPSRSSPPVICFIFFYLGTALTLFLVNSPSGRPSPHSDVPPRSALAPSRSGR